jgi:hypothetical protein|tara:strand:+ start:51 stop:485 length:435 start_codon:yes stop_codon:yes gene_type:complete
MEPINKLIKKINVDKSDLPKLDRQIKSRNAPINKFITSTPSLKSLTNKKIVSTNANRDRAMQRFLKSSQKGFKSLDAMDRMSKKMQVQDQVNRQRSFNRGVLTKNIAKTMGKLSTGGLILGIMQPKQVGDATLKKMQNEYKRVR